MSRSRSSGRSCPIPSVPTTAIVSCAEANASAGTVEKNGDAFFARIWEDTEDGSACHQVIQHPGRPHPGAGRVHHRRRDATTPELLAKDVHLAWINGSLGTSPNQRIS